MLRTRLLAFSGLVLGGTLLGSTLLGACEVRPDDEMVRPTVTTTAAPEVPTDLPDLPVGHADLGPGDAVSAHGTRLRVQTRGGARQVQLAPLSVGALVVVRGGIYFLNHDELWFTDLSRAVPTHYRTVSDLEVDGGLVEFVDHDYGVTDPTGSPRPLRLVFDPGTGKPVRASYLG